MLTLRVWAVAPACRQTGGTSRTIPNGQLPAENPLPIAIGIPSRHRPSHNLYIDLLANRLFIFSSSMNSDEMLFKRLI
jgi:hypothetical protein